MPAQNTREIIESTGAIEGYEKLDRRTSGSFLIKMTTIASCGIKIPASEGEFSTIENALKKDTENSNESVRAERIFVVYDNEVGCIEFGFRRYPIENNETTLQKVKEAAQKASNRISVGRMARS